MLSWFERGAGQAVRRTRTELEVDDKWDKYGRRTAVFGGRFQGCICLRFQNNQCLVMISWVWYLSSSDKRAVSLHLAGSLSLRRLLWFAIPVAVLIFEGQYLLDSAR